jgi:CRISPR-associated protein Csd2
VKDAFQFDQSAARPAGSMATRTLIAFEHDSQLGKAPSHVLLEAVQVRRTNGDAPPRSFNDYEVAIDEAAIPDGVTVHRLV